MTPITLSGGLGGGKQSTASPMPSAASSRRRLKAKISVDPNELSTNLDEMEPFLSKKNAHMAVPLFFFFFDA